MHIANCVVRLKERQKETWLRIGPRRFGRIIANPFSDLFEMPKAKILVVKRASRGGSITSTGTMLLKNAEEASRSKCAGQRGKRGPLNLPAKR